MNIEKEVREAEGRIRGYVRETPVEESRPLGALTGGTVYLKLENLQLTGSFKLRGAMSRMLSLTASQREIGVVAASTGNHGAAVAHAMTSLGIPGRIFVPETASPAKLAAIRSYGAEIRTGGGDPVESEIRARRDAEENGMVYISPYNDPRVIAGQGTVGVELARQIGRIDAVLVALGGGGLISGIGGFLESIDPDIEVVACSPANSAVMYESLRAGRILEMESKPTLSDGTAGGVEDDAITFEPCRRLIDHHALVTEEEIRRAMRLIIGEHHLLVEGAAGVAVAGLLKERERYRDRHAAVVLCGANIALDVLREVLAHETGGSLPGRREDG